ncbi:MAG: nickel pincer cofactor biosynthesis protein LarB [Candidatus Omnitrophota bacterium]|nr:MAG: nickel pincer cofactor biosynthesis protein LarB [Candidatus Omnitrophota bacterium]
MKRKGFLDLGFAKLDIEREKRRGVPEIIYASGKTAPQLKKIVKEFRNHSDLIFVSRLQYPQYKTLKKEMPSLKYFRQAKIAFWGRPRRPEKGNVLVITAGTSDIGVAEEAAVFLELTGNKVERIYDVGVAGVHRLEFFKEKLAKAKVIIVVAGMEGALASIVSGLTAVPLIGVPTSVGYGAHFKGMAALLGMMNSCSPGVSVVNIDNGLGAGYVAHLINK